MNTSSQVENSNCVNIDVSVAEEDAEMTEEVERNNLTQSDDSVPQEEKRNASTVDAVTDHKDQGQEENEAEADNERQKLDGSMDPVVLKEAGGSSKSQQTPTEERMPETDFDATLEKIVDMVRNESADGKTRVSASGTSLKDKYKMACVKYKVFPMKRCVENIGTSTLDLSNMYLSPHSFKPIVETLFFSRNLTKLILPNNRVGVDGLKRIAYLFTINANITHLNLANNFIGARGSEYIETILNNGFNLEVLDLSSNGFRDPQLMTITRLFNNICFKVNKLNLRDNDFQSASAKSLGQCLSANEGLRTLDLANNKFKEGGADIFTGLVSNSSLKSLILTSNEIGQESAQQLGKLFAANNCLEELDLSHNFLTKDSTALMSKGLKSNGTMRSLNLAYNPLFAQGATTLITAVGGGDNKIEYLDLTGTRVNLQFLKVLNAIKSSGRKCEVKYGHRIKCEYCTPNRPMQKLMNWADSQGISLKIAIQKIHAKFLADRNAERKAADAGSSKSVEEHVITDEERFPRMETSKFVSALMNCPLKVPEELAGKFADCFSDGNKTVDISEIILRIPLRADELEYQPEKPISDADQGKKKDAKKKK